MAEIVVGIGTSHSPVLATPPHLWSEVALGDRKNPALVYPPEGVTLSFDEGVEHSRALMTTIDCGVDAFRRQFEQINGALDVLSATLRDACPDVTIIVSDDQDEWFYEDNMPRLSVFWGDSVPIVPHYDEFAEFRAQAFGDVRLDVPVSTDFALHLLEVGLSHDLDFAHFNYLRGQYGGSVGRRYTAREGRTDHTRETPLHEQGLPHGFAFVIKRLFRNEPSSVVPVFQNTCYPPNVVTPARSFRLGEVIAEAVRSWDDDLRVAVVASGGLSHWVVDEELDRIVLDALADKDADALRGLPKARLQSAASETLNWVALGGALADTALEMELMAYVPGYRSAAATGGGWAFARWLPG